MKFVNPEIEVLRYTVEDGMESGVKLDVLSSSAGENESGRIDSVQDGLPGDFE